MSNIDFTKALTPETICYNNLKFRIPLYQRPYAWEEKQVKQLLKDLYESRKKENSELYYVGILSVAKTFEDEMLFDLIDGQQRFTTLMLIGKAAGDIDHTMDWSKFLKLDGGVRRLELHGRSNDAKFLYDKDNDKKPICNQRMMEAFGTAKKFFAEEVPEGDRRAFLKYIYSNASFFLSIMPMEYSLIDKNQQFVRMNNRGRQLEMHEILKVRLINNTTVTDINKRKKYFANWNDMVECLKDILMEGIDTDDKKSLLDIINVEEKEIVRPTKREPLNWAIVTIPEFLLIALGRYLQKEVSQLPAKLLEIFDTCLLKSITENTVDEFMCVLNKQLELLRNYFIFISRGNESYTLGKKLKTKQDDSDNGEDISGFIKDENYNMYKQPLIYLQSFLHVSTEPHHWLIRAFDRLSQENGPVNIFNFITQLETIDNELIGIRDLKPKCASDDFIEGNMTYGSISYYWFYRLDYELLKSWKKIPNGEKDPWEKLRNDENVKQLIKAFRFRRCNSIEHIDARNKEGQGLSKELLDSFGNLALISRAQNSKLNSSPPDGKKQIIIGTYAESLKMVRFIWGEQKIEDEGKDMFRLLREKVEKGINNTKTMDTTVTPQSVNTEVNL